LSESRSRGDQKSRGGSLTLQVDLSPSLRLTSLTSIRKEDMLQTYDLDGTPAPAVLSDIENHDKAFNQELRLNYESERFNLTFGGNYYNNKSQFGALQATPLATRPRAAPYIDTDLKAFALFGQAEFALTDRLTVTAGLRWNTENRDWSVDYRNASLQNGAPFVGLLFTGKVKDDVFIPSAGLDFKLTPDVLLYAKFSRGYQAPGFNGFPGATATAATTFVAENLSAYEIGMKSQFWDRRITLNLAAFHYDYSNLQVRNTIGPGQAQISNAGSAKIDGIEATLSMKLAEGLVVSGNLSYTDARYVTFCEQAAAGSLPFSDPACTTPTGFPGWNRAGNRLNNAPEWQGNIALDYTAKVGGAGELRLNVSYAAASQAFYIPANDPITSNDNAKRVDGRIGFRMNSGIEIYGYVRNLFNTLTNDMGLRGGPTFAVVHTTDPRTFGFGARYRF
jgi:iron complex outermembrane recepter protein